MTSYPEPCYAPSLSLHFYFQLLLLVKISLAILAYMTDIRELMAKKLEIQKQLDSLQYDEAVLRREMEEIEAAMEEIQEDPLYFCGAEKAWCPKCGVQHSMVRPGKTQPNCDCDSICDCGGRITYHHDPDTRWPNVAGYFCDNCGPFGGLLE